MNTESIRMKSLFHSSKASALAAVLLAGLALQACGGGSGGSTDTASDNPGGVATYSPRDTQH